MFVYVTRHAQPAAEDGHRPGRRPLTDLGDEQASRLGRRLEKRGFTGSVYTSPFRRCLETAQRVCEQTGHTFHPEPAICEAGRGWIHDFDGFGFDEIRERYSHCAADADPIPERWAPRTEEQREDVRARIESALDRLLSERTEDVLLVTHGTPSGTIVEVLCDEQVESELTCNAGYGLHYNAALTAVDVTGTPTLAFGNDTSHLAPGQVTSNSTYLD